MKVLIVGASGLLGASLSSYLKDKKIKIFTLSKKKKSNFNLDLNNLNKLKKIVFKIKPDVVINCSGLANVDLCNKNFDLAYEENVKTVNNLIKALNTLIKKPYLIQFSTDQVYNNYKKKECSKENNINIINNYALSKYFGDLVCLKYKKILILRTNFFGRSQTKNKISFSDHIIKNLKNKKKIRIPSNIYFNPVSLTYISKIIDTIINKKIYGIYNLGTMKSISKLNFAKKIAKKYNYNFKYIISYKSNSKHLRPLNTFMCVNKIKQKLNLMIPTIDESINSI